MILERTLNQQYQRLAIEQQIWGTVYGLIGGLTFILVGWGYDAWLLSTAQAALPALKLTLGAAFSLLLCAAVGWLTEKSNHALVGFVGWLAAGAALVWFAGYLPFEILSGLWGSIDPRLAGLAVYPNPQAQMSTIYIVALIMIGLAGLLQTVLVESMRSNSALIGKWLPLVVCIALFGLAGNAVDSINQPFRAAILGVDRAIRFVAAAGDSPLTGAQANDVGARALEPIRDLLSRPRQLILGGYDLAYLDTFSVFIDFDGEWAYCTVYIDRAVTCQKSLVAYPKKLACLAEGGSRETCNAQASQAARDWLLAWQQAGQSISETHILTQRGAVTWLTLQTPQDEYTCRFSGTHLTTVLEACSPLPPVKLSAPSAEKMPAIDTPRATSTPLEATPTPPARVTAEAPQASAMLSDFQASQPDLTRYILTLTLSPEERAFQGQARIVYTNTETTALERLYFRLFPNGGKSYGNGALNVANLTVDGQVVIPELSLSDSVLAVPLTAPLPVGKQVTLSMDFGGTIPQDFGGDETPAGYGIYNLSDQVAALSGWFPLLAVYDAEGWNLDEVSALGDSVYSDMALFWVDLTMPSEWRLAATGISQGEEIEGGLTHYRLESGTARDFFIAASPDFEVISQTVESVTVNSWYLPGQVEGGEQALNVAVGALQTYNRLFGPYPYLELDVVGAPMHYASGVEFPGIVLISADMYPEASEPAFITTVSHEVAHQWWYNTVGNDVIDDPWMDEALATYASGLYYEAVQGDDAFTQYLAYLEKRYANTVARGEDDLVTKSVTAFEAEGNPSGYGAIVYTKGAWFLHNLRQTIGDEAFFAALKAYYTAYQFRIAEVQDLLQAFEAAAELPLDDFFHTWLYSP